MTENNTYKVLWVEDQLEIVESFASIADDYNIELEVAESWDIAEQKLRISFKEYSAIILDAFCKLKKTDSKPSELFLGHVSIRLSRIFGEKHLFIPWYVLSAGTMAHFDIVTSLINTEERQMMNPIWGEYRYLKDKEEDCGKLLSLIRQVASDKEINKVLFRHSDVFKYLGKEEYVGYIKARTYMLKMLSAMYNPEENLNFEYEGNPLRKVIEYIFRTAHKFGLLPDDVFDQGGHIVLLDASRFMAGLDTNCYKGKTLVRKIRFGEGGTGKEGTGGDAIFTPEISMFVKNILNYSSVDSHTEEDDPYIIEEDKKEIFFGYLLQLCHVIKWFGMYLEDHPDVEANKKKINPIPVNGKEDGKESTDKTEPVKTAPAKTEPKKSIPTKEALIGTEEVVFAAKFGYSAGKFCKVQNGAAYNLKKIRIVEIAENTGTDAKKFPYIATKVELVN